MADSFLELRPALLGAAYRILGSATEAEDVVQDAWVRRSGQTEVQNEKAWLTTVVGNLCRDRLRASAVQRAQYFGTWLPEPIITDALEQRDDVRMAALLVLQALTPAQRLAFVLHDALELPFPDVARLLGCTEAAARQHASRGRRKAAAVPPLLPVADQQALLDAFIAALAIGDVPQLTTLLHPDATLLGDSGGKEATARKPVLGAASVIDFLRTVLGRYQSLPAIHPLHVNGERGLYIEAGLDRAGQPIAARLECFHFAGTTVRAIYDVVNPDKLRHASPGFSLGSAWVEGPHARIAGRLPAKSP